MEKKVKNYGQIAELLQVTLEDCPDFQEELESRGDIFDDGLSMAVENWDCSPEKDCPYALGDRIRDWLLQLVKERELEVEFE